ncbi:FAD-dependent monooxygenase [Streptomyces sp. 372A]
MRHADMAVDALNRADTAWRLMEPWGVTPETAHLERHAVYTFRGRWACAWRRGNVFLAGDAAHLMPPFLGQGLCAGLRDARALSWRIAMTHQGLSAPSVLDTYGSERSGHVREIIDEAVAAGRVICELDPDRAAARDAEMRRTSRDSVADTREPPHPRLGEPSLAMARTGAVGRLAPQGRVRCGRREGLLDDVIGGGWQLISRAGDPALSLSAADIAWFRQIGGVIADVSERGTVDDLDGVYERWFAKHGCEAFLARPDFYVFAAGAQTDVPEFVSQLRRTLRPAAGRQRRRRSSAARHGENR